MARRAAPAIPPPSPPRWPAQPGWSRPTWARWCCPASTPTPAARPSTAARCRSRRTATWAPWRAGCRSIGTLATTATFDTARATTLGAGGGSINVAAGTNFGITSAVGGSGALSKLGSGTLVLHADAGYAGGTTISAGTLQLGSGRGSATGGILGNVANNGTLAFNRSNSYTFGGLVSGTGSVTQLGGGTTILTADNTYTGGTTISAGTLQLGAGGATGGIVGNVVNNGGLVFNRGNGYAFGGVISGRARSRSRARAPRCSAATTATRARPP